MLHLALLLTLVQLAPPVQATEPDPAEQESVDTSRTVRRGRLPLVSSLPLESRLALPFNPIQVQRREALISFSSASARAAIRDLDSELTDAARRATALMALGASRAPGVLVRLEAWARGGGQLERRAALLALGELGTEGIAVLRQMVDDPDPKVAEAALFGLLRVGSSVLRAEVTAIGDDAAHPHARIARIVLGFVERPGAFPPESATLLSELRWDAARRYGLVGGKSWTQLRVEDLESDPDFVQAVVLRTALDYSLPGIEDHLLELLGEGGPAVVRAAARRIPLTLGQRLKDGAWTPANLAEWTATLEGVELARFPREAYFLARGALQVPELRLRAAGAMLAMGDETAPAEVEDALFTGDLAQRVLLCRSLGSSQDPRWVRELSKIRREPELTLRTAALVAQMRMGYRPAEEVVRSTVLDGPLEEADALAVELLAVAGDPRVPALLDAVFPRLIGETRIRVGAHLVGAGRLAPRGELRVLLEQGRSGIHGAAIVRALAASGDQNDRNLLASLFPVEGSAPSDFELNVELARALVRSNHALGMALLHRALWSPPWNQSVLAAGIMVRARGISALHQELDTPPTPVTQRDLRRVGFALGEWGGTEALEALARRRPAGDPALQGAYLGAMSVRGQ
jgi:hypothetical protein